MHYEMHQLPAYFNNPGKVEINGTLIFVLLLEEKTWFLKRNKILLKSVTNKWDHGTLNKNLHPQASFHQLPYIHCMNMF